MGSDISPCVECGAPINLEHGHWVSRGPDRYWHHDSLVCRLYAELQNLRAAVRAADAMAGAVPTSSLCRLEDEHGENLMPFTDAVAAYREARRKCGEVT